MFRAATQLLYRCRQNLDDEQPTTQSIACNNINSKRCQSNVHYATTPQRHQQSPGLKYVTLSLLCCEFRLYPARPSAVVFVRTTTRTVISSDCGPMTMYNIWAGTLQGMCATSFSKGEGASATAPKTILASANPKTTNADVDGSSRPLPSLRCLAGCYNAVRGVPRLRKHKPSGGLTGCRRIRISKCIAGTFSRYSAGTRDGTSAVHFQQYIYKPHCKLHGARTPCRVGC